MTREPLYSGNRERWLGVFDRDWIPWWVIRTYRRNRRHYPALLSQPEYAHLDTRQFTRPAQATAYLAGLHRDAAPGGTASTQ